jgi:hypothetical protein
MLDGSSIQVIIIAAFNMRLLLTVILLLQLACFDVAAKSVGCRNPIVRKEW